MAPSRIAPAGEEVRSGRRIVRRAMPGTKSGTRTAGGRMAGRSRESRDTSRPQSRRASPGVGEPFRGLPWEGPQSPGASEVRSVKAHRRGAIQSGSAPAPRAASRAPRARARQIAARPNPGGDGPRNSRRDVVELQVEEDPREDRDLGDEGGSFGNEGLQPELQPADSRAKEAGRRENFGAGRVVESQAEPFDPTHPSAPPPGPAGPRERSRARQRPHAVTETVTSSSATSRPRPTARGCGRTDLNRSRTCRGTEQSWMRYPRAGEGAPEGPAT